ncbi:MAG TPA: glycosyltransferase family 4 protein [Polyangia bacterium]|jgi:glycosyltransferase involved in cell wall biosynthesis|nr:glycosyltransferase family 4 protein [Polyangia bacterium]
MRVAFVLPGGLHRVSGGFIYDGLLIENLRKLGVAVDVVPVPFLPMLPALATNLMPFPRAVTACDVVIQDELCHPSVFLRNRRLRRAGVPVVALCHNLASRQPTFAERQYFRAVDGVVAVCHSTERDVASLLPSPVPTVVAPAGRDHVPVVIDEAGVETRAMAPGTLRVLFAGAIVRGKGLHRLVNALARLSGRDICLDVAGAQDHDRRYAEEIRAQIAAEGLSGRVQWHGLLRGEALWALYRSSHVLALPSDREAYPLVAVEALGSGLPVLVTDQGGAAEVIGHGAQGLCLPPGDVASWSTALGTYADDRRRLVSAGQAALSRFRALNTWAETASRVQALCLRVRGSRAR